MSGFFRECRDGVELHVRLTPKSPRDTIEGVEATADGRSHLAARVRAVPEKGAANAALEKLMATALGLPKKTVSVIAGGTSRLKTVRIAGDVNEISARLDALAQALR
ncbi:DUF167 family protein [Mesorhizobium sp. ANAO-SY3R2]|uniref:DUF167 family protein n=1 Tax=Mesorhizobium sp. ANAO-SY3R2 TaxID=3166644 RepID=UPI00366BCB22